MHVAFVSSENEFPVVHGYMIHTSSFVYFPYNNKGGVNQQNGCAPDSAATRSETIKAAPAPCCVCHLWKNPLYWLQRRDSQGLLQGLPKSLLMPGYLWGGDQMGQHVVLLWKRMLPALCHSAAHPLGAFQLSFVPQFSADASKLLPPTDLTSIKLELNTESQMVCVFSGYKLR